MKDLQIGERRQWNSNGQIFTILSKENSPYKVLWKVEYDDNNKTQTHEEYIILSLSSTI